MKDHEFLNTKSAFAGLLGITTDNEGKTFKLKIEKHHLNSHGYTHGGAIFTLADRAFAHSVNKNGQVAVAMEMNINYLSPVKEGDILEASSEIIKEGRQTKVCIVKVKRGLETVAAVMATAFNINKK